MYNEPGPANYQVTDGDHTAAVHLGRAVFDGRFSDLELSNFEIPGVSRTTSSRTSPMPSDGLCSPMRSRSTAPTHSR